MPLLQLPPDAYFESGIQAIQHNLSSLTDEQVRVQALHFPDMRYLLAWSQKPALSSDGILLLAGSKHVISVLRDIVDTRYVLLSEGGEPFSALMHNLYGMMVPTLHDASRRKKEISLTSREMSYMWAFMQGNPHQSDSKRDSNIRRSVMAKIGAHGMLSLLVRFRLLLFLDSHYLIKHIRLRSSKVQSPCAQSRWLYQQVLRAEVGSIPINGAFKKDNRSF
ncbi:hypothetical protein L8O48_17580 [Enterobacter cloacae]|uniref:hypothetical protein n=1 Tax=Enterobacter cloacae TaxID=550 RepID=UPI002004B156|nr:hypothetical protein [Enterobacter cloacae]MCK7268875.1 hypothetical protein [Enterobacter cloacae]